MSHIREKMVYEVGPTFMVLPDDWVGLLLKGSTTPSIANLRTWKCVNTVAVTITNFTDGAVAQRIHVLGDGFTTVANNSHIKPNTGADKLLQANKVYRFTYIDNVWYEDA